MKLLQIESNLYRLESLYIKKSERSGIVQEAVAKARGEIEPLLRAYIPTSEKPAIIQQSVGLAIEGISPQLQTAIGLATAAYAAGLAAQAAIPGLLAQLGALRAALAGVAATAGNALGKAGQALGGLASVWPQLATIALLSVYVEIINQRLQAVVVDVSYLWTNLDSTRTTMFSINSQVAQSAEHAQSDATTANERVGVLERWRSYLDPYVLSIADIAGYARIQANGAMSIALSALGAYEAIDKAKAELNSKITALSSYIGSVVTNLNQQIINTKNDLDQKIAGTNTYITNVYNTLNQSIQNIQASGTGATPMDFGAILAAISGVNSNVIANRQISTANGAAIAKLSTTAGTIGNDVIDVKNKVTATGGLLGETKKLVETTGEAVKGEVRTVSSIVTQLKTSMQESFDKTWKFLNIPAILDAVNLFLNIHNGAMLSRSLIDSSLQIIEDGLAILGLKDANGQPINFSETFSKSISSLLTSVMGKDAYANTVNTWQALSKINTAAANVLYQVQSIADSSREVLEWTAEHTGKIGNSLKRDRVVSENSYAWMPERVNGATKWQEKLNNLGDAASSLGSVVSEVRNVGEETAELAKASKEFADSLLSAESKLREDNKPVADDVKDKKNFSQNPASFADVELYPEETPSDGTP